MAMSMMTLLSLHPKPRIRLSSPKLATLRLHHRKTSFSLPPSLNVKALLKLRGVQSPAGFALKASDFKLRARNEIDSGGDSNVAGDDETEARGPTTMPDRFRYLTKEAPEKPVLWPWLVVTGFMLYAWRSVLWELGNWTKALRAISELFLYISKLTLAVVFHFIGDLITSLIWGLETTFYKIRSIYSAIIAYAPIKELILIILLTSCVLAVAEATVPDSVNGQPKLLTVAGVVGFAAVANYISEPFFWTLLLGLFSFARLVKKRDYVSSALPVAAVLVAVGEPWIRAVTMASYFALAVFWHYRNRVETTGNEEAGVIYRVPLPLSCAAFAIGIRLAANWAGYRHLTWMVV